MREARARGIALPCALLVSLAPGAFGQDARDVNVKIVSVTSPVSPGWQAILVVHTNPGALCTPMVSGPARASLGQKRANADGVVTWRTPVPEHAAAGRYQLTVACSTRDQQGSAVSSVVVY